jgi:WD40 repeat protein
MAFPEILPYFDHPNLHWPAALALEASDPQESRRHVITCAFKKPGDETPTLLPNDRRWAQFSADGREFGIAGLGWAMAWPLSGGDERLLTPERQPINGATFLPNGGQMLITYPTGVEEHWRVVHLLSGDTAVQLPPLIRQSHWDPLIKKDVSLQEFSKTVLANLKLWRDLTISADQSTIFCATGGDLDAFRRTSKGGYERVGVTFRGSPAREEEVCFASALAPDGSVFVTASTGSIRVWDLAADRSGAKLRWQKSWDGVTNRLLVTPDGCILAARSIPGDVRVLHPLTGDLIRGLPVESTDAQLTPDGKQLVVARPGGLDVWDWRTGQRVAKHDYGNGIARRDPLRLVVSSDGLRVAVVFPDIIRFHNLPALLAKQE